MKTYNMQPLTILLIMAIYVSCLYSKGTTVGGHFKMTFYDYSFGERTFIDSTSGVQKADGARSSGMTVSRFTLMIMREIAEIFTITIEPNFEAVTGATPKLGKSIGDDYTPGGPVFTGWQRAHISVMVPYPLDVEITGGIIFPRFTMDYGGELFFEEEYNGSKFAVSSCLGEMSATGIELYKAFELGFASMPAYLYIMNGSGRLHNDNNESPEVMLHIEPEFGPISLFGSILGGRWDNENKKNILRWSGGLSVAMGPVELRSEYAGGKCEKSFGDSLQFDATPHGFYTKLICQFSDWGKLMLHYNYVNYNFIGTYIGGDPGREIYSTVSPAFQVYIFDFLSIQSQFDIADWHKVNKEKNITDKLKFNRVFLGLRATF